MPSSKRFLFMHDNARPHIPMKVYCTLRDYGIKLLDPCPAHSPDFNPIEHVWSWMRQYINSHVQLIVVH